MLKFNTQEKSLFEQKLLIDDCHDGQRKPRQLSVGKEEMIISLL